MGRIKVPAGALQRRGLRRTFIRHWREFRDLKQDALADQVEDLLGTSFTRATLSRIENARSPYSQRQLEALADTLKCTEADLLYRNPLSPEDPLSMLESLSPTDRDRAVEFMRALKESRRGAGG